MATGPDRVDAEQEARALGVDDRVSFLGKIDAVAPLLAGADLFLLPSDKESFGLSALEALASGVPVIGTRAGGLPEVVRDGETGFLCGVGDVDGMAQAAISVLSDRPRWERMSRLAAADARERFSLDEIVGQYEAFYEYTRERVSSVRSAADRVSFDAHSAAMLATLLDVPRVELFDVVGSTQDVAHALAAKRRGAGNPRAGRCANRRARTVRAFMGVSCRQGDLAHADRTFDRPTGARRALDPSWPPSSRGARPVCGRADPPEMAE